MKQLADAVLAGKAENPELLKTMGNPANDPTSEMVAKAEDMA